jgi:predicted nucleotidyltransferase
MIKFSEAKIKEIAGKYGLADVYVFGSKITGFQREDSDVDIGVRFKNGLPEAEKRGKIYGDIFSDLSFCFKGEKLDLVFIDEVPLHFQFKIINEGKIIYSADMNSSADFVEKTAVYYNDYKYFIDEYFQGILEMPVK